MVRLINSSLDKSYLIFVDGLNGFQSAGQHILEWDSTNEKGQLVPGGVYFYTIQSKTFNKTKKFLLVK